MEQTIYNVSYSSDKCMSELQKPGEKPKTSGEYIERGPRGGEVPNARQVTMEPGDNPLPPTKKRVILGKKFKLL